MNDTEAGITDTGRVHDIWTRRPYSVLLVCGEPVDVVEIPELLGRRTIDVLRYSRDGVGPIAVTPRGTWLLLVAAGSPIPDELAQRTGAHVHTAGAWVALPPTTEFARGYRWRLSPCSVGWRLPLGTAVHRALLDAMAG